MTADTLKTTRVLELYQDFLSGKLINKQQAAEQYHVNARSIQRDIDSIRDFLSEQCAKEGIVRKIEYDKKENGYSLVTQEIEQLSRGEVLALCKILLESRAFTKEQVEKQLQIILNLCVSTTTKRLLMHTTLLLQVSRIMNRGIKIRASFLALFPRRCLHMMQDGYLMKP